MAEFAIHSAAAAQTEAAAEEVVPVVQTAALTDPPSAEDGPAPTAEALLPMVTAEIDPGPQQRVLVVSRGDTLAGLLSDAGIDDGQAQMAIASLSRRFRPNTLRPGHEIAIRVSSDESPSLLEVEIEPEAGRTIRATRQPDGGWTDEETLADRDRFLVRAEGAVDGGLFPAMTRAGVPAGMALSLIRILGHQVDFQRDLQPGDRFSILFDRFRESDGGDVLGHGQILKASLTLSDRTLEIWRHRNRDGDVDWYDAQGRSLRRSFLRTPLDGARISSGFGRRSHPVLGYTRMHQGIDFAAPTGTPVYAAGDGTIVSAKREGGYGLLVRIRHANGVQTRYAHLSRFARGIAAGRTVRQGSVIGHVGSTGMSTGPHLHYEVVVNNRAVNPAQHVQPPVRLAGAELTAFRTRQRQLTGLAAGFATANEVALAPN
ncbi:peptidoglycan DD-metalloendopeptidase family protein [Roseomonas terrae]|uniref:Peptidoglycan DD-metalloendopeptidase family protein n=1 Tax=Neoroseomonas terrae TaxID=424799 RepID=A0ABS5EPP1_9PROT|nr:peptidoglycan DD-metalloendopeptidase family protein [Neoroseomonas terrae]MBR0652981.1 peptidoglycan DD-metalloendopeptidase family protein [Neoroseomonas terrae]